MPSIHLTALCAAALLCPSAGAATLTFTLTNLAPAQSVSLSPAVLQQIAPDLTDVLLTRAGGDMMEVLPELNFFLGLNAPGTVFPPVPGGPALPVLDPGDTLTFSLLGVDLNAQRLLQFGAGLYAERLVADDAGTFAGFDLTFTAGSLAEFFTAPGGSPLLVLPGSPGPGPDNISPQTPLLRLTVVPEPGSAGLLAGALALTLRRRR